MSTATAATTSRHARRRSLIGVIVLLIGLLTLGVSAETVVSSRVTQEMAEGVLVDVGTFAGLDQGVLGSLRLYDGRVFEFEVLSAQSDTALLRLTGPFSQEGILGRTIELAFEEAETAAVTETVQPADTTQTPVNAEPTPDFVPLLAPRPRVPDIPQPSNVSRGRLQIHQMVQTDSQTDQSYWVTRMSSSGSVERLGGSPWSFEWSGNMRYRDGDAYESHRDYREPTPYLYEAMFQRPLEDGGFFRLGRFLPRELPGIGYVDGLQGESRRTEHVRIGAIAGLKPGRIDLEASADEPLVAGYTTIEAGNRNASYYSGTVSLLSSPYDGDMNRLALLLDQRAGLGPKLTLYSTASVDFDTGVSQTGKGTSLTRLDLYGVAQVTRSIRLRAGVDHWERPDNLAERDLLAIDDDRYFDDGYWRYWVGSDQRLGSRLRFSQEVSLVNSDSGSDDGPRWRLGATRRGFFGLPDASMTLTVYNLSGAAVDGYGGRLSGYLPLLDGKLFVQPTVGFRLLDTDAQSDGLTLSYASLRLDGRVSKHWTLFGGGTYSFGDDVDAKLFELGLRYSW